MIFVSHNRLEVHLTSVISFVCFLLVTACLAVLSGYYTGIKQFDVSRLFTESIYNGVNQKQLPTDIVCNKVIESRKSVYSGKKTVSDASTRLVASVPDIDNKNIVLAAYSHKRYRHNSKTSDYLRKIEQSINSGRFRTAITIIDENIGLFSSSKYSSEVSYLKARALTGQYLQGAVSGSQVIAAWNGVKTFYRIDSNQFNEADSILGLFGVK